MAGSFLKVISTLACAAMLTTGCGTGPTSPSSSGGGSSADATKALDCRPKATAALTGPEALALADGDPDLRHVPADNLTVTVDGQAKTLCDLLRDANKPLAMFQLVSVKCYDCMKWVESLNNDIGANNLGDEIMPVAIVPDPVSTVTDAEIATMKGQIAGGAIWARDTTGSIASFFSLGDQPGAPLAPETVIMDYAARGFYCDQKGTPATALVEIANRLMDLKIGQ